MTTTPERSAAHVVQAADGEVLAVFSDAAAAHAYAAGRPGRRVSSPPLVNGSITTTTVHTRWVEIDADGEVRTDRDSYTWCAELDLDDGAPPTAEIEYYRDGPRRRLLCVGTDLDLIDARVREALAKAAAHEGENTALL